MGMTDDEMLDYCTLGVPIAPSGGIKRVYNQYSPPVVTKPTLGKYIMNARDKIEKVIERLKEAESKMQSNSNNKSEYILDKQDTGKECVDIHKLYKNTAVSKSTHDDRIKYFNLSALPPITNIPEPLIGHVYMCRPHLNLIEKNMQKLATLSLSAGLMTKKEDRNMYKLLGANGNGYWLPIVTNYIKNYNVNDIELKNIEKGGTFTGNLVNYAQYSTEYKHNGTISLEFRNDYNHSILKLMMFWFAYMYYVTYEDQLELRFEDVWNGCLDYDASIYFLVTRRDGREIVYWEQLVGVHPIRIPLSMFSWNDKYFVNDTVTIDFSYSIRRDPYDAEMLVDMNCTTACDPLGKTYPLIRGKNTGQQTRTDIYSKGPIITKGKNNDGQECYFLEHAVVPDKPENDDWYSSTEANINKDADIEGTQAYFKKYGTYSKTLDEQKAKAEKK